MKIATVVGTRPELIRLCRVIDTLDRHCDHVLVHTGQNFHASLSDVFFDQLRIRQPNHYLGVRGKTTGKQIAEILVRCENVFLQERPDRLLILGDTNSALCAVIAKRMGIPVFHMEAGNRCHDDRVPEEINRRIIDHVSDVLMPYTERSRANLLAEGIPGDRIYVIGNPILEVLTHYMKEIQSSTVLGDLGISPGSYFLTTLHRAENIDIPKRAESFWRALSQLSKIYSQPVVVSTHPRTADRMRFFRQEVEGDVRFVSPFGFFDFIHLEMNARCVLSDSGTVQEECAILRVPNVTLRDVTERPETIDHGSNILAGANPDTILDAVRLVLDLAPDWTAPPEYLASRVSPTVVRILTGFNTGVSRSRSDT